MKKLLLLPFCILLFFASIFAQDNFTKIGIIIYSDASLNSGDEQTMENLIRNELNETAGFEIFEREKLSLIQKEREFQKGEDFTDAKIAEQGKAIGADYLFIGNMTNLTINGYQLRYDFALKVIDVENGTVKNSFAKSSSYNRKQTKTDVNTKKKTVTIVKTKEARFNLIVSPFYNIRKFIWKAFPPLIQIVEIVKSSKSKAKKVLVASDLKLPKSHDLIVFEIEEIDVDGEVLERQVDIGKLDIGKRRGDNFVICEVEEGGKEIFTKFNSNVTLHARRSDRARGLLNRYLEKVYEAQ